jgi:hypothetical protein
MVLNKINSLSATHSSHAELVSAPHMPSNEATGNQQRSDQNANQTDAATVRFYTNPWDAETSSARREGIISD